MKNKILILTLMIVFSFSLAACGNNKDSSKSGNEHTVTDREGNDVVVKEEIETIISFSPNITQVLVDLGLKDKLIAIDSYSYNNDTYSDDIVVFEGMMNPDMEVVMSLNPDIILSSSMNRGGDEDSFKAIKDAGIAIAYVPSSQDIEAIKEDIAFIAAVTNKDKEGRKIIDDMQSEIDKIAEIGKTIEDKKTVYFEISPAPQMYSFGSGVFLNDLINIIGAENILAGEKEWLSVSEEVVPRENPDVILTNTSYEDFEPIEEIKSRKGWSDISAVKNDEVYLVDTNATSLSNHNIVIGLKEMAKAIYPDVY